VIVRALAIVGIALLIGMVDSYKRPIQVSLQGNELDPTRTDALKETEKRIIEGLSKEDENNPKASLIKRGGSFISVEDAKKEYDLGVQFFDARVEEEFKEGHVKGAVLVDPTDDAIIKSKSVPEFLRKFDPRYPVIVYCNGGDCDSSQLVAIRLRLFGFTNVKVFEEGYPAWKAKGYPVEGK
jgi:rhodanese-related sulfurtransferase